MKFGKLILGGALAISVMACNQNSVNTNVKLATADDSLSYAIGIMNAANALNNGLTKLNPELMDAGYQTFMQKEEEAKMTPQDAQMFFRSYQMRYGKEMQEARQAYMTKMQEKAKAEAEKTKAEGAKFLEENAKKDGVVTTESGLQYKVIKEGSGEKPLATDKVKVHYTGTLLNGEVFDSSKKQGKPIEFPLNGVIKGWTEGVQLMAPGAVYEFYIKPEMAYGDRPVGNIPAGSTLIFEVELLEVLAPEASK